MLAAQPQEGDLAAAWGFVLTRLEGARLDGLKEVRPWVLAAPRHALAERGRPSAQGMGAIPLLLVSVDRDAEALWALEEALRSGAVAGGVALVERAPFVMTRRLDLAARRTQAVALLLRPRPRPGAADELSAAALRWRVSAAASRAHPLDPRAPGPARWRAELVRRRDGWPGTFMVEQEDEAHRLDLAARLADHGPVVDAPRRSAA
jgi:protein ImuA